MKKGLLVLLSSLLLSTASIASENTAKGLNVIITSEDAQTQMMGMVLSMMTLKENKEVNDSFYLYIYKWKHNYKISDRVFCNNSVKC